MIIEGYKRLIKEQEDLIRRLCMDLEQVQKKREEALNPNSLSILMEDEEVMRNQYARMRVFIIFRMVH